MHLIRLDFLQHIESKSDDEINLEKAKNYHEAKNYTAAWSIYDALTKSGNPEAKFQAGRILRELAERRYSDLERLAPQSAAVREFAGRRFERQGRRSV